MRNHILALEEQHEEADIEDEEPKKSQNEKNKKKEKTEVSSKVEEVRNGITENKESKLLSKKTQRKVETIEVKKDEAAEDEEDYNFQFKKPEPIKDNKIKAPNAPFKRINENVIETLDNNFKDNSYETFMNKSGNQYGKEANEKLKVVRGKDFRKEKTKFKNKSSAGGYSICTEIKSIKLDLDSD